MTATQVGTVAAVLLLGAMLVPTGAALPAQANQHAAGHADTHADRATADSAGDSADDHADRAQADTAGTQAAGQAAGDRPDQARRGPPVDLPGRAPAFVADIHQAINSILDGTITVQTMVDRIHTATPGNATAAE